MDLLGVREHDQKAEDRDVWEDREGEFQGRERSTTWKSPLDTLHSTPIFSQPVLTVFPNLFLQTTVTFMYLFPPTGL